MRLQIFALAAAASLTAAAGAACAHPAMSGDDVAKVVVRYADLDLTRTEGATVLARRISLAAQALCGAEPRPVDLGAYFRHRACVNDSAEAAIREVGAPLVTAIYERELRPVKLAGR